MGIIICTRMAPIIKKIYVQHDEVIQFPRQKTSGFTFLIHLSACACVTANILLHAEKQTRLYLGMRNVHYCSLVRRFDFMQIWPYSCACMISLDISYCAHTKCPPKNQLKVLHICKVVSTPEERERGSERVRERERERERES